MCSRRSWEILCYSGRQVWEFASERVKQKTRLKTGKQMNFSLTNVTNIEHKYLFDIFPITINGSCSGTNAPTVGEILKTCSAR